jgi:hypothetical protein
MYAPNLNLMLFIVFYAPHCCLNSIMQVMVWQDTDRSREHIDREWRYIDDGLLNYEFQQCVSDMLMLPPLPIKIEIKREARDEMCYAMLCYMYIVHTRYAASVCNVYHTYTLAYALRYYITTLHLRRWREIEIVAQRARLTLKAEYYYR